MSNGGGTFPNLFDAHPPFQIDGNLGGCAGIAEMLLQSHAGELELLPALPKAWASGRVKGLRGRGGYSVDLAWDKNALSEATIGVQAAGPVRMRMASAPTSVRGSAGPGPVRRVGDGVYEFQAQAAGRYDVVTSRSPLP